MKAIFFTGHEAGAPLKASIPFMAETLAHKGWQVDMVTVGESRITQIKGKKWKNLLNQWFSAPLKSKGEMRGYIWIAPFHPIHKRSNSMDGLFSPIFRQFAKFLPSTVKASVAAADLVIIESGFGVMLAGTVKKCNPKASIIYVASDRLSTLGFHPVVREAEIGFAPLFNLIVLPAQALANDFPAGLETCRFIPQGIEKTLLASKQPNPYLSPNNLISVGDMLFDPWVVKTLAEANSDWNFHLFGAGARIDPPLSNVHMHGQVPFSALVPYLQYADIGLAPYSPAVDSDYLSQSSLKLLQYTYCRLPIIAPFFAAQARKNICPYQPGDAKSLHEAFEKAKTYNRSTIDPSDILSWEEVVERILKEAKINDNL